MLINRVPYHKCWLVPTDNVITSMMRRKFKNDFGELWMPVRHNLGHGPFKSVHHISVNLSDSSNDMAIFC